MSKKSKYATKRAAGNQMYGPGCCAHKVTDAQIQAGKDRAARLRRQEAFDAIVAKASQSREAEALLGAA